MDMVHFRIYNLRKSLDMAKDKFTGLTQEQNIATNGLESQIQGLNLSLRENISSETALESKENKLADLESKLEEIKIKLQNIQHEIKYDDTEDDNSNSLKGDDLIQELEIKKKEIEKLNLELKKRTHNLQELVNKELWSKNREIEKLNKLCDRFQIEIKELKEQLNSNNEQVSFTHEKFNNSETCKIQINNYEVTNGHNSPPCLSDDKELFQEYQLLHFQEKKKILEQKVEELEGRLQNMSETDNNILIEKLKSDLIQAKQELETSEKFRKEIVSACSLLTNGMQELADLLDSLLPSIGDNKHTIVQHAVQRSRELSRSFSSASDDLNLWKRLQSNLYRPLLLGLSKTDFGNEDDILSLKQATL
ncbi:uncharacterized protein LOC142318967 isoform X3 [Lycorma delicatula]|uniref:uncharacterized protein LOC142318967 isoform X3 n=1 Tax=Lycorma delicatula TaxID=130591 RepID=UPI003F510B4F